MSQQGIFIGGGGGGGGANTFVADAGVAVPLAGVIDILGTANEIHTSAAGHAVTISLPTNVTIAGTFTGLGFDTSDVANNVSLTANTITGGGTNPNVGLNIVAQGTGNIDFTTATGGEIVFRGLTSGFTTSTWHEAQQSVQTLNATPTVIESIVVPLSHMVTIKAYVNGFQSDFTDCVGGEIIITAYRTSAGNVTLVGAPIINVNYTDLVDTSDIDADVNVGTQTVRILVVGVAAQTWNWVSTYYYMFTKDNT